MLIIEKIENFKKVKKLRIIIDSGHCQFKEYLIHLFMDIISHLLL